MPAVPEDVDDSKSGVSYQSLDLDGERTNGAHKPTLKERLTASLSQSSLSSLFKRSASPSTASASSASAVSTSPLLDESPPSPREDEHSSQAASTALPPPLPAFLSSPSAYCAALSQRCAATASSLWSAQLMAMTYLSAETRRNSRGFLVGLFTVFLVVSVIALIQNETLKSPVIFFKVAENSVGETDVVLTPGLGNNGQVAVTVAGLPLLNQSLLNARLPAGLDDVSGTSGRWIFFTRILSPQHQYEPERTASAIMLGIDSLREAEMGLGRTWRHPPLQPNHSYVSRSIVRQVGYTVEGAPGQSVLLRVDAFDFAKQLGLIPSEGYADPTVDDVIALLAVLDPTLGAAYWQQTRTLYLNLSNVPAFNTTDYRQIVHSVLYSNETIRITGLPFNFTIPQAIRAFDSLTGNNLTLPVVEALLDSVSEPLQALVVSLLTRGNASVSNRELLTLALPYIVNISRYDANFTIAAVLDEPDGKWPTALGAIVMLENEQLVSLVQGSIYHLLDAQITDLDLSPFFVNGSGNVTGLPPSIHLPFPINVREALTLSGAVNASAANATVAAIESSVRALDGDRQSILSVVNFRHRVSAYLKELEGMNADLIAFTNAVALSVGLDYPAAFSTPIAQTLTLTQYIRYFLDNIFYSVVVLIVFLGVLLIFSLLLHDVDAKTYEYGMLRALGMRHRTLVQVLVSKSFLFSVPGIALGLLIAYVVNVPLEDVISGYASIPSSYSFYTSPLLLSIAVGLVMPLVANIVPISRALSRTLRDSLDVYHHVISDVTVRIIKLADLGLDLWQTALAVLMVAVGFVTFYVVPYASIFGKIPLFLGILNGILLGMLLGLCIIAQAVQPSVERAVLRLMLSVWHRKLHGIVKKNLSGHRGRNAKTAQMFTICLAFIVFAGVMFSLQASSLVDNVRLLLAADINVQALPNDLNNALREEEMTQYLERQRQLQRAGSGDSIVLDYTFLPFPINSLVGVRSVQFSALPQYQSVRNFVYGVSPNFLQVVYDEYYITSELQQPAADYPRTPSGQPDVIAMMYAQAGEARLPEESDGIRVPVSVSSAYRDEQQQQQLNRAYNASWSEELLSSDYRQYLDVVIGEALRGWQSVNTQTALSLYTRTVLNGYEVSNSYLCKARAMVQKVPGFFFSSYRVSAPISAVLVRQDEYDRVMRDAVGGYYGAASPKQRLLVKIVPGSSLAQREDVINALRTYFRSDKTVVTDTARIIDTTMVAVDLMQLFFQSVGVVTMLMCFFILWLSFTANVQENSWEFGVLRALGLNQREVVCVYVYEAVALVLTSLMLGSAIGLLIAASLTAQFNLFTEMPFHMVFPHALFWSMVGLALLISVLGSAVPAYSFLKHSISSVLRGQ